MRPHRIARALLLAGCVRVPLSVPLPQSPGGVTVLRTQAVRLVCRPGPGMRLNTPDRAFPCARVALQARHSGATLLALTPRAFYAVPAHASRGPRVLAAPPGSHGRFTRVRVGLAAGRWQVRARLRSRSFAARYRLRVSGVRVVRVQVAAHVIITRASTRLPMPVLATAYTDGLAHPLPAGAVFPDRHLSDGLFVRAARSLWMPLRNPRQRRVFRARVAALRGFGFRETDRRTALFGQRAQARAADASVRLATRPRATMVLAADPAGRGARDNVTAYAASGPLARGTIVRARYTVTWRLRGPRPRPGRARVVSVLIGGDAVSGARKYVIDETQAGLSPKAHVTAHVRVTPWGFVTQDGAHFNPFTPGWRQVIQVLPEPGVRLRIAAWLTHRGLRISPVFSYAILPLRVSH